MKAQGFKFYVYSRIYSENAYFSRAVKYKSTFSIIFAYSPVRITLSITFV